MIYFGSRSGCIKGTGVETMTKKKVAFATLGCKMNQADTEAIRLRFERSGYEVAPFDAEADVYIVNTCTVTGETDRQCRQMLRRAMRARDLRPGVKVVATGCYAQVDPAGLEKMAGGLDIIAGALEKENLVEIVESEPARENHQTQVRVGDVRAGGSYSPSAVAGFNGRTRGFLRAHDGCDARCAYCVVPIARGPGRSAPLDVVLANARALAASGHRELVVTGIHIGRYGLDLPEKTSLARLLRALCEIPAVERVRLSSIEPGEFTPELLGAVAELPKLCPHFHISLQSGDPRILKSMRRAYTPEDFLSTAAALREINPDVSVGADVITGFPGEDEAAFLKTREFVELADLSYMHVFRFSERPGTEAAGMSGKIGEAEKKRRAAELNRLRAKMVSNYQGRFLGRELDVLFEESSQAPEGELSGLSGNYLRVRAAGPDSLKGRICKVIAESQSKPGLRGRILPENEKEL